MTKQTYAARAARENARKGGRGHVNWYRRAAERVDRSRALGKHRDFIMADWPEGEEHWRWVATATVREIVDWAEAGQR